MSFKRYAFTDVIDYLNRHPSKPFDMLETLTRAHVGLFRTKADFKVEPRYVSVPIEHLFDPSKLEYTPVAAFPPEKLLPALYCTVGDQVCCGGRTVKIEPRKQRVIQCDPEFFLRFENDLYEGFCEFNDRIFREVEGLKVSCIFRFNPLGLH